MRGLNRIEKKGVIGPVISVFVMVLIISILSALTFLFVAALKTNVTDASATTSATVTNETGAYINETGYSLARNGVLGFRSPSITSVYNSSNATIVLSGNYTVSSTGVLTNASTTVWSGVNITYTYTYISEPTAYEALNETEAAGTTVVGYLPLIFLAIIFGAILTLVLRIILPYINLGSQMGGF